MQMNVNQPSETYKRLHRDVIEALIEQICSRYEEYFMRYLTGSEKTAIAMWKKFEEYKEKTSLNMSSNRLDRHKLASCICGTIIEVRPLGVKSGAVGQKTANEILALYTGLNVVKLYMIDDLAKELGIPEEEDNDIINYMYKHFNIHIPLLF